MRDVLAHDSRRVRLLALLGVAAAIVLVRAETSQAFSISASAVASEALAEEREGQVLCRGGASNVGPCFFIAVTVVGGGRVESTADPAGTQVRCPASGGHECTVPEWFIWALDVQDPFIDFTAIATTGQFQNWTSPTPPACHTAKAGDPAVPQNGCRIYANNLDTQSYEHCITANFTDMGGAGGCVEGTPAPVGDPIVLNKAGTGAGTVSSSPAGINCGVTCTSQSKVFPVSVDPVTLFASTQPGSGSTFAGWSGVGHSCSGTGACSITVQGQTIRAVATFNLIGPPPPPPPPAILNAVILSKPAKTTRNRTARFTWAAKRGTSFVNPFKSQCKLNKQAWKSCRPAKVYRNLKPGRTHTFRVRVKDAKRNVWDKTPAVWSWRIRR
jgi:hypothetical protein